jgi:hypothetical protein
MKRKTLMELLPDLIDLAEEGQNNRERDADNDVAGAKTAAKRGEQVLRCLYRLRDERV